MDLKSTVLCATSSYALLLAEEIAKRGIGDQIHLKKGIIGSERWGEKMRRRIAAELGVKLYDIYGLTEVYGPGIGMSCDHECGMHYWDDYIYFEIIDPKTGEILPGRRHWRAGHHHPAQRGGSPHPVPHPRPHPLSARATVPAACAYPRIDTLIGRTDDMVKVKGVNIFPGQIDELLSDIERRFQRISGDDRPPERQGYPDPVCGGRSRGGRKPLWSSNMQVPLSRAKIGISIVLQAGGNRRPSPQ